ncbi:phosphoribosyltransferase-like protein [Petrimonas sp.]|uniref:phosphoribosyltransferase-like protein n=1 Tax=Petrimonas sp. TaxID=2023866 RepID=UPI003F512641
MTYIEIQENLKSKIKVLNETLWDNRALNPSIEKWLVNFSTEKEKLHALYLLSKFMYFGAVPMRNLLKSLYRDFYRYPLIESIRKSNGNTLDSDLIENKFKEEEKKTRFLGVGNLSESGAHLLYFFRQENKLSKEMFVYTDEILDRSNADPQVRFPEVKHYVFIDDFCGSGSQATNDEIINQCVVKLKKLSADIQISYLMLFATSKGVKTVKDSGLYDNVEAVIELDDTYKCFDINSRIFPQKDNFYFEKDFAKEFCYRLGRPLFYSINQKAGLIGHILEQVSDDAALGWGNCQLLLGFFHNTPDNTLPIIWYDEEDIDWVPIFKRYNKKYNF